MTIQQLNCFLTLAENLSYTKTAEALYISQPAVSKHIRLLEEELGFTLIDRSSKRAVSLTEAGQLYHTCLRQCNDLYRETMETIRLHAEQSNLILNLLRGTTIPNRFVDATRAYMSENPRFNHFINFIDETQFSRVLDRGEVLICSRELMPSGKNYSSLKLNCAPVSYYLMASKGHRAFANSKDIRLGELVNSTLFLTKSMPKDLRRTVTETLTGLLGKPPRETFYVDSFESVALFLRSNECFTVGTGWDSALLDRDYRRFALPIFTDFYAIWDPAKQKNPYCEEYLNLLSRTQAE